MAADFNAHLHLQHERLNDFIAVLEHERVVLENSPIDIAELATLTDRKRAAAQDLDRLEQTRYELAANAGHAAELPGGKMMADAHGCSELWAEFVQRVYSARDLNEANGAHIDARLNQTERTLAFLDRASAQSLYAANGRHASAPGQRISHGA